MFPVHGRLTRSDAIARTRQQDLRRPSGLVEHSTEPCRASLRRAARAIAGPSGVASATIPGAFLCASMLGAAVISTVLDRGLPNIDGRAAGERSRRFAGRGALARQAQPARIKLSAMSRLAAQDEWWKGGKTLARLPGLGLAPDACYGGRDARTGYRTWMLDQVAPSSSSDRHVGLQTKSILGISMDSVRRPRLRGPKYLAPASSRTQA